MHAGPNGCPRPSVHSSTHFPEPHSEPGRRARPLRSPPRDSPTLLSQAYLPEPCFLGARDGFKVPPPRPVQAPNSRLVCKAEQGALEQTIEFIKNIPTIRHFQQHSIQGVFLLGFCVLVLIPGMFHVSHLSQHLESIRLRHPRSLFTILPWLMRRA